MSHTATTVLIWTVYLIVLVLIGAAVGVAAFHQFGA